MLQAFGQTPAREDKLADLAVTRLVGADAGATLGD
jgi:hypothetical protein